MKRNPASIRGRAGTDRGTLPREKGGNLCLVEDRSGAPPVGADESAASSSPGYSKSGLAGDLLWVRPFHARKTDWRARQKEARCLRIARLPTTVNEAAARSVRDQPAECRRPGIRGALPRRAQPDNASHARHGRGLPHYQCNDSTNSLGGRRRYFHLFAASTAILCLTNWQPRRNRRRF